MGEKREKDSPGPSISIGGNVGGSVTVGDQNVVVNSVSQGGSVILSGGPVISQVFSQEQRATLSRVGTAGELQDLGERFQALDREIQKEVPSELQPEAKARAEQLKAEAAREKPDPSVLSQVKGWFVENLPSLLGTVTGILTHPIVGKLVEAAGEYTLGQFRARLGLPEDT